MCAYFDIVIYHGGCPDGTAGAWVFRLQNPEIETFGVRYDNIPECDFTNKKVVIVDHSYSLEILDNIHSVAQTLIVLDHHESSRKILENLDYCYFDLERSGSQLAWDYVYGGIYEGNVVKCNNRPWFIDVISDRDLWKWEIPDSRAVTKALFHLGFYTFEKLDSLYNSNELTYRAYLKSEGQKILDSEDNIIKEACNTANLTRLRTPNGREFTVKLIKYYHNLRSEIGNALADSGCDFSAMYRYNEPSDEWWITLRGTKKNDIDVSTVASEFVNGGGHSKAAGFTILGREGISAYFTQIGKNEN